MWNFVFLFHIVYDAQVESKSVLVVLIKNINLLTIILH